MKTELAQQLAMLKRELTNLEALLASDSDWKALSLLEAQKGSLTKDAASEDYKKQRQALRSSLSENRIFTARERIVEAIALIRQELERDPDEEAPSVVEPMGPPAQETPAEVELSETGPIQAHPSEEVSVEVREIKESDISEETIQKSSPTKPGVSPATDASASQAEVKSNSLQERLTYPSMMSQVATRMTQGKILPLRTQNLPGESTSSDSGLSDGEGKGSKVTISSLPPETNGPLSRSVPVHPSSKQTDSMDDLSQIRGISEKTAQKLNALGVRSFHQIASWTAKDVSSVRAALGFDLAIAQQNWIEQAAALVVRNNSLLGEDTKSLPDKPESKLETNDPKPNASQSASTETEEDVPGYTVPSPVAVAAATILENFDVRAGESIALPLNEKPDDPVLIKEAEVPAEQSSKGAEETNAVADVVARIVAKLNDENLTTSTSAEGRQPDESLQVEAAQEEVLSLRKPTLEAGEQESARCQKVDEKDLVTDTLEVERLEDSIAESDNRGQSVPGEAENDNLTSYNADLDLSQDGLAVDSSGNENEVPGIETSDFDLNSETAVVEIKQMKQASSSEPPPPVSIENDAAPDLEGTLKAPEQGEIDGTDQSESDVRSQDSIVFEDAEIEIVQIVSDLLEDSVVTQTPSEQVSHFNLVANDQVSQADEVFDADSYAGYSDLISEASVSIIANNPPSKKNAKTSSRPHSKRGKHSSRGFRN